MKRPLYVGVPAPGEDPNEYNKRALASIEEWSHEADEVIEDFDLNGHSLIVDDGFGIVDENGNEQLIFQTTASAVNYWEMTNAAAGGVLRLEAKGDDTHVAITFASKGTDPINLEVNGATEATLDATNFKPGANDGNALGASGTAWADLFLASGGIINWNAGNATITHSAGLLTSNVDIAVPDEVYDATNWNGSAEVPTKNAIRDKFESLVTRTVGEVVAYVGTAAPSLWLLCFGQAVSRTTYAALYAVTGDVYGAGDGTTTFNVPDLRGRVVAGQDDMGGVSANRLTGVTGSVDGDVLGGTGGEEAHTITDAELPVGVPTSVTYVDDITQSGGTIDDVVRNTGQSTGSGTAHNTVQPTIVLNYIIYAGA